MIKSTIKQHIPECVTVYRDKPQYPSGPAPVRELRCECGFKLTLKKSGRKEVRMAACAARYHVFGAQHNQWANRRAGVRRLPLRKSRRVSTLKASDAEAQRIKWREQKRRRRATLKRRPRSKKRAG